jgi:hypothetical protein
VTSSRARRRAGQRALDVLEAGPATACTRVPLPLEADHDRGRRPTTSHRAKHPTPAGKAEESPIHGPGRGGRDRRTAAEYARALARETEVSLRRDPSRWKWQRSNELPKNRSTEPEATP